MKAMKRLRSLTHPLWKDLISHLPPLGTAEKGRKGKWRGKAEKTKDVTMETDSGAPGTSAKILGLVQDAGKTVWECVCARRQPRWCRQPLAQRTLLESTRIDTAETSQIDAWKAAEIHRTCS